MTTDLTPEQLVRGISDLYGTYTAGGGAPTGFGPALADYAQGKGGFTVGGQPITQSNIMSFMTQSDPNWNSSPAIGQASYSLAGQNFGAPAPSGGSTPPPSPPSGGTSGGGTTTWGGPVPGAVGANTPGGLTSGAFSPQQLELFKDLLASWQGGSLWGAGPGAAPGLPGILRDVGGMMRQTGPTPLQSLYLTGMGGQNPGGTVDVHDLPGVKEYEAYADQLFDKYNRRMTQQFAGTGMDQSTGLQSILAEKAKELGLEVGRYGADQRQRALQAGLGETDQAISRVTHAGDLAAQAYQAQNQNLMSLAGLATGALGGDLQRAFVEYERRKQAGEDRYLLGLKFRQALGGGVVSAVLPAIFGPDGKFLRWATGGDTPDKLQPGMTRREMPIGSGLGRDPVSGGYFSQTPGGGPTDVTPLPPGFTPEQGGFAGPPPNLGPTDFSSLGGGFTPPEPGPALDQTGFSFSPLRSMMVPGSPTSNPLFGDLWAMNTLNANRA